LASASVKLRPTHNRTAANYGARSGAREISLSRRKANVKNYREAPRSMRGRQRATVPWPEAAVDPDPGKTTTRVPTLTRL